MQCKDAGELIALAETNGVALTKDEAEAYLAELADVELDEAKLEHVAGGICWEVCGIEHKPDHAYCIGRH